MYLSKDNENVVFKAKTDGVTIEFQSFTADFSIYLHSENDKKEEFFWRDNKYRIYINNLDDLLFIRDHFNDV